MTMLDRMRRHKGWLKWSLALVCLAFVVFYIPSFLRWGNQPLLTDAVASVDGTDITTGEFRRVYLNQLSAYRGAYGGKVSEQLLKQLGIEQQILQQMVDEQAALAEARHRGLSVTDAELAQRIMTMPAFQENGKFFGSARYEQLLRMQQPPLNRAEFEDSLRRTLLIEKLRAALTEWMSVGDADVEQEYNRRNQKVKVELVSFAADKFRDQVKVSDVDVEQFFKGHSEQYRVGEKRRIKYVLVDLESLRKQVKVTEREIDRAYNDSFELYLTPEQVRASHILFKTEGKKDEEVKARAEQALKEARAGKDFAELAKQYSEDEATAKKGGDLDYFARGTMVPEFDDVAFKMEPGTISDLVKSQYGYHIIKLVDKRPAASKPIEEVKPQITDQLTWEKGQARANELATALEKEISKPADLDRVAQEHALKVQESLPFSREEPILGIGAAPQVASVAFDLNEGQVSAAVQAPNGYVFLTVTAKQAPYVPKLDEVKDRVREDLIKERSAALATEKARSIDAALKSAADFTKATKAAGLEVKTSELIARESAYPDIGVSPEVDQVAFRLKAGEVSDPIQAAGSTAIIRLVERKDPTPQEFVADKERLRTELLGERQNQFFSAYMMKAKQRMDIQINRDNLQKIVG